MSQSALAGKAGLTRDQIKNIELTRTMLPLGTALKIAEVFRIGLAWLAEEFGPQLYYIALPSEIMQRVSINGPFLQEYENEIRDFCHKKIADNLPAPVMFKPLTDEDKKAIKLALHGISIEQIMPDLGKRVNGLLNSCPPEIQKKFFWQINDLMRDFIHKHDRELRTIGELKFKEAQNPKNINLTNSATPTNLASVKNQWPALKRKLQETTADTGSKSRLAKFLGVDLTRVSQWLTDAKSAREPGAEYALQMKYWVEHPECQK